MGWGGVWVWCGGGTLVHFLVWALAIGRCIGFGQVGRGAGFWVSGSGRAMGRGVTMCRGGGGTKVVVVVVVVGGGDGCGGGGGVLGGGCGGRCRGRSRSRPKSRSRFVSMSRSRSKSSGWEG